MLLYSLSDEYYSYFHALVCAKMFHYSNAMLNFDTATSFPLKIIICKIYLENAIQTYEPELTFSLHGSL
jgi:hypothetical protein